MHFPKLTSQQPIFLASLKGELLFLQNNLDLLKQVESDQRSLIHFAASAGHLNILEWLLENNHESISDRDKNGASALHYAAAAGHLNVVQWLLKYDFKNTAHFDNENNNVLAYASYSGNIELMQWFFKNRQEDFDHENSHKLTVIHHIGRGSINSLEVLKWLLFNTELDVNSEDNAEMTVLHYAAETGNLDLVQWLIKNKLIELNRTNVCGMSALECAAASGQLPIVQYLVNQGANLFENEFNFKTSIHHAAENGHTDVVEWILDNYKVDSDGKPIIDLRDDDGMPLLMSSILSGNIELIVLLIEKYKANPTQRTDSNQNAFQILDTMEEQTLHNDSLYAYLFNEIQRQGLRVEAVPPEKSESIINKKRQLIEWHSTSLKELLGHTYLDIARHIEEYLLDEALYYLNNMEINLLFHFVLDSLTSKPSQERVPVIPLIQQAEQKTEAPIPPANVLNMATDTEAHLSSSPTKRTRESEQEEHPGKRTKPNFFVSQQVQDNPSQDPYDGNRP